MIRSITVRVYRLVGARRSLTVTTAHTMGTDPDTTITVLITPRIAGEIATTETSTTVIDRTHRVAIMRREVHPLVAAELAETRRAGR